MRGIKFTVDTDDNNFESVVGIDQDASGGYYLAISNNKKCTVVKTTPNGQLSGAPILYGLSPTFEDIFISSFKKVSNGYLLVGTASAGTKSAVFGLKTNGSFDYQEHTYWYQDTPGGFETGLNVVETADNQYIFCGSAERTNVNNTGAFWLKINAGNMDPISNGYLFATELGASANALVLKTGGYIGAGKKKVGSNTEACFFHLNSSLGIVPGSLKTWNATSFDIKDMVSMPGGRYALAGNDNLVARIRVVDADGNLVWDKSYPGWVFGQLIVTADQRLIMAGDITVAGVTKAGWLEIRADTGEPKGQPGAHLPPGMLSASATCVVATADGGFAIGGSASDGSKTWNILIKTDQSGRVE